MCGRGVNTFVKPHAKRKEKEPRLCLLGCLVVMSGPVGLPQIRSIVVNRSLCTHSALKEKDTRCWMDLVHNSRAQRHSGFKRWEALLEKRYGWEQQEEEPSQGWRSIIAKAARQKGKIHFLGEGGGLSI